jgi:hypothetical protein
MKGHLFRSAWACTKFEGGNLMKINLESGHLQSIEKASQS